LLRTKHPETAETLIEFSNTLLSQGQNNLTEMYSAIKADVVVEGDPATDFNQSLFDDLVASEKLVVCGQAMSHCVNFTLRDVVEKWPAARMGDITLLTDGASSVPGFTNDGEQFVKDMVEKGVRCVACNDF